MSSMVRAIKRRMQKEDAVLGLTDKKTRLKRQKDLALRTQRTKWFFEGLVHACGHQTERLDAYHQKIANVGTTICSWSRKS